jgi:hypothetical protein
MNLFDEFDKRFYNKSWSWHLPLLWRIYSELKEEGSHRTADTIFILEIQTIFQAYKKKETRLPFDSITKRRLLLENYCLDKGHSNASIGIL